jgi:phytoene synthase
MTERNPAAVAEPAREALQRALPPGSLRQLAVLFADADARPALGGLYALEAELRRVVAAESHEAAHARLQWWRAELERLAAGRPTHPLAVAMLPLHERGFSEWPLLHELIVAADLDLVRFTYHDWAQLEAYCFRSAGALQTAIAAALSPARALSSEERDFARRLGAGVRQAEMLRDLAADTRRGRIYAPLDALARDGIDPLRLGGDGAGSAGRRFLEAWRWRVRAELLALPAVLGAAQLHSTQRHGLVLAALHVRLLERLDPSRPAAPRRLDVEPVGRLWTAWRTALRHA